MTIAETEKWLESQPPMEAKHILSEFDRLLLTEDGDSYYHGLGKLVPGEELRQYAPNIEGLTDEDFR